MSSKKSGEPKSAEPRIPPAIPLKPRPKLFLILCIAFAVWLAALIVLYFTSVYPLRHPAKPGNAARSPQ
jgi:hypothetical protein